jgi:hypothetical protein
VVREGLALARLIVLIPGVGVSNYDDIAHPAFSDREIFDISATMIL